MEFKALFAELVQLPADLPAAAVWLSILPIGES